jgi:sodium transport system permease protein
MNARDIWTLYRSEVRTALRERTIVVNSILIPLLLYPGMIFVAITGFTFISGQTERFVSRIEIAGDPQLAEPLRSRLDEHERVELIDTASASSATTAEDRLREGSIDALVRVSPGGTPTGNLAIEITSNSTEDRSLTARGRIEGVVRDYRGDLLEQLAEGAALSGSEWEIYQVEIENTASERQMGALLLSVMLPVMFIVMVAVGCFYPAIDATAGERERRTWETTMTIATARANIVVAKYLYVATFGCIAGFLNVAAITVSLRGLLASLLAQAGRSMSFQIELSAIPAMILAAVLLAGFIAAGMMIFAAFARTFREGQSMVGPFYLVVLLPVFLLNDPGLELDVKLALVPVVNVGLMVRSAITGDYVWLPMVLTCLVSLATIAGALWLATRILRFEDVVMGSYGGNFGKFLKQNLLSGKGKK